MNTAVQGESAAEQGVDEPGGVIEELSRLLASGRAALARFFDLLSLEARHAYSALVWMAMLGIVAAVCMVSAWLGVMAALVMWIVALGLPLLAAALVVAVLNGAASAVLIYAITRKSRGLLFSATRRRLAGATSGTQAQP